MWTWRNLAALQRAESSVCRGAGPHAKPNPIPSGRHPGGGSGSDSREIIPDPPLLPAPQSNARPAAAAPAVPPQVQQVQQAASQASTTGAASGSRNTRADLWLATAAWRDPFGGYEDFAHATLTMASDAAPSTSGGGASGSNSSSNDGTSGEETPSPPLRELQQMRGYPGRAPTPSHKAGGAASSSSSSSSSGGWWFWPSSQPRPHISGKVISV